MQISIQRKVCNASMLAFQTKSIKGNNIINIDLLFI